MARLKNRGLTLAQVNNRITFLKALLAVEYKTRKRLLLQQSWADPDVRRRRSEAIKDNLRKSPRRVPDMDPEQRQQYTYLTRSKRLTRAEALSLIFPKSAGHAPNGPALFVTSEQPRPSGSPQ